MCPTVMVSLLRRNKTAVKVVKIQVNIHSLLHVATQKDTSCKWNNYVANNCKPATKFAHKILSRTLNIFRMTRNFRKFSFLTISKWTLKLIGMTSTFSSVKGVTHYVANRNNENCRANRKISAESARLASGFTVCTFAKHLLIAFMTESVSLPCHNFTSNVPPWLSFSGFF